jgi:hypothetical protein
MADFMNCLCDDQQNISIAPLNRNNGSEENSKGSVYR